MKKIAMITALAVVAILGLGTTNAASAANGTPAIAKTPFKAFTPQKTGTPVATILSCAAHGLVNSLLQYNVCQTSATTQGTTYFNASGSYLSEGTAVKTTDAAVAAGWSSNGSIDGLFDFTFGGRVCATVDATVTLKGKGSYALQNIVLSWHDLFGNYTQVVTTSPAESGTHTYCGEVPPGAYNPWAELVSLTGAPKGAKTELAETLVSAWRAYPAS